MTAITLSISNLNTDFDDEPRVQDLVLAKALGFARPRNIRDLIERNKLELETYGSLAVRRGAYRGQALTEYWLNEGQALLICMFSRSKKAAQIRKLLIEIFMAFRRGQLEVAATPPSFDRMTEKQILEAATDIALRHNFNYRDMPKQYWLNRELRLKDKLFADRNEALRQKDLEIAQIKGERDAYKHLLTAELKGSL